MTAAPKEGSNAKLANGVAMPRVGLGVYLVPSGRATREAVLSALRVGYRHVDTAQLYGNEADVGQALAESKLAHGEVFVTTKLWNADHGFDRALAAFDASRRALGVESVDLFLLHWPVPRLRLESWRALEQLYDEGRVRAIGVSNFMIRHLEELLGRARIVPMVNQIEVHPFFQQREVRAWCLANNIAVAAYSPLAKGAVLADPVVKAVAAEAGATPAQTVLAWGLRHDLIVLPKSVRPARQTENLAAAKVRLTARQVARLDQLERGLATDWDPRRAP
ncbi:MAG TPA: aldo/keto reductase [Roseiarcus sp.]|nr:aldo/keto reductase [Roseiarcus sp.]